MGAKIPEAIQETALSRKLAAAGLNRVYQGKVRDTCAVPSNDKLLLVVASGRLSIFDFVLNCQVKDKGQILTALTIFWLTTVLKDTIHHLIAFGAGIDAYLPPDLRGNPELQARAVVVRKLEIISVECVVRGCLTGSGWRSYRMDGTVCGQSLPPGLHDGSRLDKPIFTPTSKAVFGHDQPMTREQVRQRHTEELEDFSLAYYNTARSYAEEHDVIIADTKFEFGRLDDGSLSVLADEVITPDSSRFWDREEWEIAQKEQRAPQGYDKEPVRQEGKGVETPFSGLTGIHSLDAQDEEHIIFVHQWRVPKEVLSATRKRYRTIFERLTGRSLESFQRDVMHIG